MCCRVQLPDDFLAAPEDFVREDAMYDDEQLSTLLQNEMFQREVALTLGRQNPLTYAGTLPQRSNATPPHGNALSYTDTLTHSNKPSNTFLFTLSYMSSPSSHTLFL